MTDDREDRPRERPIALLVLALVAGVLLVLLLWVLLPDSPVTVVLLGLVVLGAVGLGLWRILLLPQFSREPERRPREPPEAG